MTRPKTYVELPVEDKATPITLDEIQAAQERNKKNAEALSADDEERAKLLTQMQMFNTQQGLRTTRNMLEGAEAQFDAFLAQSKARNPQLWASKAAEDVMAGTAKTGTGFERTPIGDTPKAKAVEKIEAEVPVKKEQPLWKEAGEWLLRRTPVAPYFWAKDWVEDIKLEEAQKIPYSERVIRSTFAALDEIPRDSEGRYLINGMAFTRDELMPSMQREVTAALHPQLMATSVAYRNDYAKSLGFRDFNAYIDETIINPLKALDEEVASEAAKKADVHMVGFPRESAVMNAGAIFDAETKGRKEIRDAIDAMESLKRGDWSAAFTEGFDFLNFTTLGVSSLGSDFNQIRMLNKVKNGEELTSEEQRMYDIYKITQNANALREMAPQTLWQDIWRGIGTTAQLSSQFIPVMGVASSVANLGKVGVKAGIGLTQRALRQGVVKGVMTGIKQTGRVSGKLGLNVLKANWAGLVVSPLQLGTYSTFLQKREEQFKVVDGKLVYTPTKAWIDVVDTLIEQTNEISSEVLGAGIADVVGVSFKSLGKMIGLDKVINGVSSKLGLGASYNKIFGLKKSDAFKALERRLSYTGDPVSEGLSEIWGDISSNLMKMCITGTEDFSKLRDPKYWATNLAVAGIYGTTLSMAHSAASLPTYAEIAHLGKAKHQALRNISSKELKDALRNMGVDETVNEAAFRLAQLNWSSFSPTDRANAMDFLRAESQQQILIGINEENNFMARFTPVAASIQQHAYRGKEGDADTGLLYEGTLEDGSKVSIISGDMSTEGNADNLLMVMGKDGNITPMARSKFKEFSAHRMGDVITAEYQRMYGTESIKNELAETEETFEALEQPTPKEAMEYMRKLNIPIPEEGEKVKLVDGREGMFLGWNTDGSLNVEAQKADSTYELLVMPFHKILSAQGNIAQVQQEMLAGETLSAAEEAIETETPEAEVRPETETPEEAQVEAATAIEEAQNDVADISAVPMTEDGNVDFGAITDPALYAKMYVRELGNTEVAIEDVSKMRSMAEQSILKLEEKRETLATANERIANRKEVEATKTRIAFYDAVLDILSPKEAIAEPVAETSEVETPEVETPVAEVETPTMETPTFYEGDIVEHNGRKAEVVENRGDGTYIIDYKMSDNAANQDIDIVDGTSLTKAQEETEAAENTVGIVDNAESRKIADDVYNTVNSIAKSLGITVEFVPIVVNSEGQAVNGLIAGKKVLISSQFATECVNWLTGHEFLHYMKSVAPEQYSKYTESVKSYLGEKEWNKRMKKQKALYLNHKMTEKANNEALMTEECVADFTGEMVEENDAFNNYLNTVKEEKGLLAAIKRVLRAIGKLFTGKHKKRVNEMLKQVNALIAAAEKANTEGVNVDAKTPIEVIESAERLEEKGGVVDVQRGDAKFALADVLTISEQEQAIQDLMRVTGRSRATVQKYIKAEQSLARFILSGDNAAYLDYEADDSVPSIWENSDYPQGTVEFSNICRKRLPLTMIYQKLQKEFPNTKFNKTQLETIRQTLIANGIDVACGLCFVEDRRQHNDEIGQGFIDALSGKDVYVNANQQKAIDKLRESGDNYIPNLYELLTLDGMKKLRMEHPDVANAFIKYNNARGQQAGRLFQAYSAYHREILKFNNARVKKTNDVGGLRIFSFSDFEAHHLIDLVQVLTDCARKGIKVQGYTKVPEFALAVKDTGMKLNRSLIAKDNGVVEADYSPKTGEAVSPNVIDGKRLLLDTIEGIDVNDKNFFDSSTSKNVGNILVGVNDEQIRIAMLDPFVDYIIPFHTGLSADILKQKGISDWKNYKYEQIEKTIVDGKMVNAKTHINIYTDVLRDDIKTEKQFVERYLEVCKEKNLVPKFARFLNRDKAGDFVYTKGYYKFLLDFKMFDTKGRILPQETVQPIFNDEVNEQILDDYVKGEKAKAPNEEVYEEVKEALGLGVQPKFSLSEVKDNFKLTRENAWDFEYALMQSIAGGEYGARSDYRVVDGVEIRVKGHAPNWDNFVDWDTDEPRYKIILNVTVGDYDNTDYRRKKTEYEEFIADHPDTIAVDVTIEDGTYLGDALNEIHEALAEKGVDFSFKPNYGWADRYSEENNDLSQSEARYSMSSPEETAYSNVRYSIQETDPVVIEQLNNGKTIKVYRAMQVIDGKLYPPMSAKVNGKLREPIELGVWEKAEERPDLADDKGYFKLDKGNSTSLKARYNPYIHTSLTPLNDQFSSAQDRPNLVTVEVEIPESELTSGYKAEKAKDAVGKLEWKAGVVQSQLTGTRTVILSRWDRPLRIVPDSEVAQRIVEMFGDTKVVMPSNVVTPSLRRELEELGVEFRETDNQGKPRYSLITPEMDASYLDAVERGDMATAQRMVMEAAEKAGYINDESWRMNHRAPRKDEENANPFNTEKIVPEDFWEHPEWYTNIHHSSETRESYYAMKRAIDKYKRLMAEGKTEEAENVTITMYRGVDKTANKREASFRNGDWITPSRSYALLSAPYGKARVISQEVKLKDIWWDGNSINEWGYDDGANYGYRDTKNNRKLLDPVTYDDAGNIIPLSERFNPKKGDIRYSLIGEKGALSLDNNNTSGARLRNLNIARQMEAQGKDALSIKMVTNWERGTDGLWRYEMDDSIDSRIINRLYEFNAQRATAIVKEERGVLQSMYDGTFDIDNVVRNSPSPTFSDRMRSIYDKYKDMGKMEMLEALNALSSKIEALDNGSALFTLEEVLGKEHPILNAYPQLSDVSVLSPKYKRGADLGYYDHTNKTIMVRTHTGNTSVEANTLVHEIQHAIQHIEGFATGGNRNSVNPYAVAERDRIITETTEKLEAAKNLKAELEARNAEIEAVISAWENEHRDDDEKYPEDIEDMYYEQEGNKETLKALDRDISGYERDLRAANNMHTTLGNDNYYRLAGEVEARTVAKRRTMTPEQRRSSLAVNDSDVAPEDRILIRDHKMMSPVMRSEDIRYSLSDRPTGLLNDFTEEFKSLQKEYESLGPTTIHSQHPFRIRKRKVVQKYLNHVSEVLGLPCEVFVLDSSNEQQVRTAYRKYVASRLSNGNTSVATYEEFKKEIHNANGGYFKWSNLAFINIDGVDTINTNSEYLGSILHENAHKIIEGMGVDEKVLEAIYEEAQNLAKGQVDNVDERYPDASATEKGEEIIAFALQTRASFASQKDMLMQFFENEVSEDDILNSFNFALPLRDRILKDILIALRDGYNNKHNNKFNNDNGGETKEGSNNDRLRGEHLRPSARGELLSDTRYSLPDMPFFEDNGDVVSFEAMTPEERKMAKYEDAQRMTSEGADAQAILDATGWLETEDGWEYFGEADIDLTGDQDEMLRVGRWLQSKRAVKKSGIRKMYAELIKEQRGVIKDIKKREAEAFASRGSIKAQVEALLQGQAPESLPIEDQVLVDIARGQRLKWKDGNGKRGLSTELGLTNARAEKMGAVTIGATDYLEDYVTALMERNNGYENDIDDNDIRNAVIEMFRSYPSPKRAVDELYGRYATSTAVSEAEEGIYRLEVERDNALAEIDAEHNATMENFEANPAPFIREYNESAAWQAEIDMYTNSLRKAKSAIDRMTAGRATESANRKSKAEAVRSLKTFINNMLRGDLARYTHKRDIVALMNAVNESTTIYQMQRAVNKAMESAYNIRLRKEVARMNNLTKMRIVLNETNLDPQIFLNNMVRDGKMTAGAARTILNNYWRGVNASGVAIAKGVDGDTSEIMAFIHENIDLAKLGENKTITEKCNDLRDAVEGDRTLDEELKAKKIASVDIIEEYLTLQQMINALREINGSEKPIEQTIAQQATEIAKLNNELRALEMQKEAITRTDRGYKSRKTAIEKKLAELRNAYNTARTAQEQAYASYYGSMPDIIERLYQANTSVEKLLKDGIVELSRQKQAEADHRNELIRMALEDINRPYALESDKVDYTLAQKAHDSGVGRFVTSQLNSLDHMLRRAGENAPNGEGRLWKYFVPKLLDAYNRLFDEQQACADIMNRKCKQLFGKDYNKTMMEAESVVIGTRDEVVSGKVKTTDVTIAQALNIIATWDQADGRASLEKQGYTEEKIQALIGRLYANNPKWMAFEQWVVHTFLPSRREKYNKVHRSMFGVNMNKEINYFPIRRDKGALYQSVDLTKANFDVLPSTITGSIIKRTKSTAKIDLDNSFFEVLRDHIVDMEKWAEIAPITKDFNTMLSSKAVQAVMNAKGKHFLDQFKEAAKIATLNFTGNSPEYEKIFMPIVNRMWASSLLAFKPYTALKQLASSVMFAQYSADPRFVGRLLYYYVGGIAPLPDSVFLRIGKGEVEPQPQKDVLWNIQWAKKNSAMFRERWESVAAGNEAFTRQIKYNTKLGKFVGEGIKDFTTLGMRMIAFVDAYTSAAGMRAVYDVTYRNLKEKGASHEEAHKEAMFRAEMAVNKTQQSAQFLYLSPIQMSRGIESMLATFNNAPFAQGRLIAESWAELIRNPQEERRVIVDEEAEWLKTHQYARAYAEIEEQIAAEKANGTLSAEDENKRREELQRVLNASVRAIAEKKAPKIMRGHKVRAALALTINAYIAQFAFNAMAVLPYMFFGDDDEKKKQLLKEVALWSLAGPLSTIPMGNAVISAFQGYDFQPLGAYGDLVDDINKIVKEAQKNGFNADVALMTADFLARKAVGVDYKTYFNLYAGLDSLMEDGYSHEALLKMLNAPNSQVRLLAGERREGETAKEYVTRILRLNAILDDNIYEDNYEDGKYTGNNRPVTMSKTQMRNLMSDYEREYRSDVLRRKAGYVKRAEIEAIDEEYAKVMEAMGWKANSKPNKKAFESGKYEAPVSGVRIEEYRKLASLATRVANAYDKTSRYIGDDEGKYYDYILAEMERKQQMISEFNKAINTK
jgi:hypothetical protein